jgi:hypothetical protein
MNEIWHAFLNGLIQASVPMITMIAVAVAGILGQWILKMIKNTQTQMDDRLAALAVAWAEDFMGGGKGEEKLDMACQKLEELTGGRIKAADAETIIRATYQRLFGVLKPLKNG